MAPIAIPSMLRTSWQYPVMPLDETQIGLSAKVGAVVFNSRAMMTCKLAPLHNLLRDFPTDNSIQPGEFRFFLSRNIAVET
jgi:hypothetical protein